ncbi:kynureninase [Compostimonas suwonensis]|uniref:Kynureninase n=1 Tax=Compostimonas suwonensis TaxID=1048394 RepID=A0A2M9C3R5_9MICO|nr:aminotransferase class V-fold PLP-dependent enzyme [Compostimonas suwonensis]PJJ65171.1 kynureninase [Compostimonas suwonensis]
MVEARFAADRTAQLDETDALAGYRELFVRSADVVSYLDGNSLGRPLIASADRLRDFALEEWGGRLIRGWDEGWLELPFAVGDELARVALGAASGQTFVGDSTTVLLYKLARAAVTARPGRQELVVDTDNFPTDRYVIEGIAAETGCTIRWIESDVRGGVSAQQVAAAVGGDTALVLLSNVAYRSGFLADVATTTELVHRAGALVLWDLCHSVGVVPTELDAWGVDLAVGCSYKYLNGGPGSPAFAYVRSSLQDELRQPIQGWLGSRQPFEMGPGYEPADGIRRFTSGTPPIVGMLAMRDMIALLGTVGVESIRQKSVALTEHAVALADELLVPLGVELASPRTVGMRGGHVSIDHPDFRQVVERLWRRGVVPDFRAPRGIRLGLSPLSTSFAELRLGVEAIREELLAL